MNILGFEINRRNAVKIVNTNSTNPVDWWNSFNAWSTDAGISVTIDKALELPAVYSAIKVLSESIAQLALNVYRITDTGKEIAYDHPLQYILHTEPSEVYTSFTWRETMEGNMNKYGNSYSIVKRNARRQVVSINIVPAEDIEIKVSKDGMTYFYYHKGQPINSYDVIHLQTISDNGVVGISPINIGKEVIALGLALQQFGAAFFGNGTSLSGTIETAGTLSPDAAKSLSDRMRNYMTSKRAFKVLPLDNGMTFKKLSVAPNEAQFNETRSMVNEEIARLFRIPQHMIQKLDRSTNNNIEMQSLEFVKYTILPRVKRWEQELNRKLLTESEKKTYMIGFNLSSLLRADDKTRAEYYTKALQNMWMNPNEVRDLEDMNDYEGGDAYIIPKNMNRIIDGQIEINPTKE